jgi:hypothetical protein
MRDATAFRVPALRVSSEMNHACVRALARSCIPKDVTTRVALMAKERGAPEGNRYEEYDRWWTCLARETPKPPRLTTRLLYISGNETSAL